MGKLHIEKSYGDNVYDTYLVEGLSPEEVDSILNAKTWGEQCRVLAELLDSHENDRGWGNIGSCWGCGYGIYDIRHFGGHLMVKVGNSCD